MGTLIYVDFKNRRRIAEWKDVDLSDALELSIGRLMGIDVEPVCYECRWYARKTYFVHRPHWGFGVNGILLCPICVTNYENSGATVNYVADLFPKEVKNVRNV